MGQIINNDSSLTVYLKPIHTLGRDSTNVDTQLNSPLCSRLQCILMYQNGSWSICDHSKNGTFINGERVPKDGRLLSVGDIISVAGDNTNTWTLTDTDIPCPVLIRKHDNAFLELSELNLLPEEDFPEILLSYIQEEWVVEKGSEIYTIESGDILILKEEDWQFFSNDLLRETLFRDEPDSIIQLNFQISLNEENIQLIIKSGNQEIDFGYRAHHEVLLLLARQCLRDNERNVPIRDHGWIATELFMSELGVNEYHLNTLIYRCRKAFQTKHITNIQIERRQGEIRLSPCNLLLQKGDECFEYAVSA